MAAELSIANITKNPVYLLFTVLFFIFGITLIVFYVQIRAVKAELAINYHLQGETLLQSGKLTVNPQNSLVIPVSATFCQLSSVVTLYSIQLSIKLPSTTSVTAPYSAIFVLQSPIKFNSATCTAKGSIAGNEVMNLVPSLTSASSQTFSVSFTPNLLPENVGFAHIIDLQIVASSA